MSTRLTRKEEKINKEKKSITFYLSPFKEGRNLK